MEDVVWGQPALVPISLELLGDCSMNFEGNLTRELGDYLILGRSRRNSNPLPTFMFFPRTQRLLDALTRFHGHVRDARYAFRRGLPDEDGDW